jgi:hypothetical protein
MLQVVNTVHDLLWNPKQDSEGRVICVVVALGSGGGVKVGTENGEKPRTESELTDRTSEKDYLALMQSDY